MKPLTPHLQVSRHIQHLSRVLAVACLMLIVLLPIAVAVYWMLADVATLAVRANLSATAIQGALLTWQRIAGGLMAEIPLVLLLIGVWQARQCFRLFSVGQLFTSEAVCCLKRFSGWAFASALAGTLTGAALSVVLTLNNPPAMHHLAISVGSDQIFLLFFAAMVWLMANVIHQGQRLAEENATFI